MPATFGSALRALRKEKRIGLSGLARSVGWSTSYLCQIEKGNRHAPTGDNLEALIDALAAHDRASAPAPSVGSRPGRDPAARPAPEPGRLTRNEKPPRRVNLAKDSL